MSNGEIREMKKKVCLIGDSRVGKTSLLKRYMDDEFLDKYVATISAKIFKKNFQINVQNNGANNVIDMTLKIWDLVGHCDREYWSLMKRYFLNTDGVLFVCDLSSKASLDNLKDWIVSVFSTIGVVPFIVMANKADLGQMAKFNEQELVDFTKQYNSDFFYTSAKTGTNVSLAFQRLGEIMAQNTIRVENIRDPRGVLNEIVMNYCVLHGGQERAMPIINHQFKQAGADINAPTKESLLQVIERLTQVTQDFKGKDIAKEERNKYLRWVHKLT
jgi:small GTP-binding protein